MGDAKPHKRTSDIRYLYELTLPITAYRVLLSTLRIKLDIFAGAVKLESTVYEHGNIPDTLSPYNNVNRRCLGRYWVEQPEA